TNAYKAQPLSADEVYRKLCEYGERLAPFITYTEPLLREALQADRKVLFEGAQGTLLDLDFGSYPYVTSSTTTAAGIFTGAGMAPRKIDTNMGVFKAYNTRVGAGPMPTELKDALGDQIRNRAGEFGATTGRPRRCGWFDAVAARYSVQVNGFNAIALTRLDVLDILPAVKICTAYRMEGQVIQDFPTSAYMLERCLPVYEELPGWQVDTSQARTTKELPRAARAYIKRIEKLAGCRVELISVGAQREHTIEIKEPFRTRR
ncbi:MAG: adenylosuccinate synthetase, partial [Chloroflexi bacterium]|nr:adenylosuccinate synthetase [Chloroflexota bacterium]